MAANKFQRRCTIQNTDKAAAFLCLCIEYRQKECKQNQKSPCKIADENNGNSVILRHYIARNNSEMLF